MFEFENSKDMLPFSLNAEQKLSFLYDRLHELTIHHYHNCPPYKRILDSLNYNSNVDPSKDSIPFIPVRLFKEYELMSVDPSQVIKTMTSSGTTGQQVSKIYLDRITSTNQTKVLTKIVSSFIGNKRLPMLIIDTKAVIKDRNLFSARGAGILGFSMLGYDVTYALDEDMNIDFDVIEAFIEKHKDEQILLFGFTFMIWEHFYNKLQKSRRILAFDQGILIHGGGWKKLAEQAVDNDTFKQCLNKAFGIGKIYNYYGMVEQTGSIYMECEAGHLHAPIFSDVIIRDHRDFSILGIGQKGLVQLLSLLPHSYPGHSILTEDVGELLGEDDCCCGRKGKYFKIHGRVKNAEIRGCSDVYASSR
ncbi:acyl-protein synthetase [Paenibacillus sp. EKM208P]|nr:acyl-protein synthetase [Paenibacillus sp. EKM208P]